MSRYAIEEASGHARLYFRIRACVRDTQTGDAIEVCGRDVADELVAALEKAEAGELEPLRRDASPFHRYELMGSEDGWAYLLRSEGAVDHSSFARTRSETFAERVVDALNRANPRLLRNPNGPQNAGWF